MIRRVGPVVAVGLLLGAMGVAGAQPAPSGSGSAAPSVPPGPAATASSSAGPAASGSLAPAASGSATPAASGSALPPGHPPAGHPPTARPGGRGGIFQAEPDRVVPDPALAPGHLVIDLVDADGKPIPNAEVALLKHVSSVTEGDSRDERKLVTNADGQVQVEGLQRGRGVGYKVKAENGPATFVSQEFGMPTEGGIRVRLHRYEPVSDLARTPFVMEAVVLLEAKPDHIVVNHRLVAMNLGRNAYVPQGVTMPLPAGYEAFNDSDAMGMAGAPQKIVDRDGRATLVGTFPPGQSQIFYRYQVPIEGGDTASLRLPLPPRVVGAQVVVGANEEMGMTIAGFPAAQVDRWQDGKRVLVTTRRPDLRQGVASVLQNVDPTTLDITLTGLPVPGPMRYIAVALGLLAVALGAAALSQGRKRKGLTADEKQDLKDARTRLLREMELLERARLDGEVSARNYERIRVALLDALARIVSQLGPDEPKKRRKKRRRAAAG